MKKRNPKLPKLSTNVPAPPPDPQDTLGGRDLDKHTSITIGEETFDIEADDLEVICELGRVKCRCFFKNQTALSNVFYDKKRKEL